MSEELQELSMMEGGTTNRPPKPIVEMTDEELTSWVQSMRDCLTQFQTLLAEAKVSKKDKEKEKDVFSLDLFE